MYNLGCHVYSEQQRIYKIKTQMLTKHLLIFIITQLIMLQQVQ